MIELITSTAFIISLLVMILLFFILRGLFLWYWKVNQVVELLTGIYEMSVFLVDLDKVISIEQIEKKRVEKTTIRKFIKMNHKHLYKIVEY